jgi:RimJ/RimL family protein N-acetyltransferase
MNREDGHCFIGAFIDEKYRRRGYGPETMLLYVRYLFAMYALRKIYVEIFDYNALSLGSLLSTGLPEGCITKEGCFKGHRYFNGAYHDVHRFAIYPEAVRHFSWLDNKESRHNSS